MSLNQEQSSALAAITDWLKSNSSRFFVLQGGAGCGKTYLVRELVNSTRGRFVYTAPTNKATKVLRKSVTTKDYTPECRTIYSLLGLRLEASGEIKELREPEDPIDLSKYTAVVVDEGSMVNASLMKFIEMTAELYAVKFLFLGDPAQLPPVKELRSPIWAIPDFAELQTVMRHDNQILTLATKIRKALDA